MKTTVDMITVIWPQHPAGRLIDSQHPTIFIEDVNNRPIVQFKAIRLGHGPYNHIPLPTSRHS
jgi:hypothetical protein